MGDASGGPRRLSIFSSSLSAPPARSASRSGAAVGRCCAAHSRRTKAGPSCACAASCKRRSRSARKRAGSQASTPPTWPLFKACSKAQRLSEPGMTRARVCTTSNCATSKPSCASAWADSLAGGSNSITSRPCCCMAVRQGPSRRISPTPGCGSNSSVNARRGQPPPGSCASSVAKPVGKARPTALSI